MYIFIIIIIIIMEIVLETQQQQNIYLQINARYNSKIQLPK